MERASKTAGKVPKAVITDKLWAYLDGIELAFGAETKHIRAKKLTAKLGTQLIERFHGTLKSRTKIMRGLKKRSSAKLITDGWLIHYNFFRPHESLGHKTPAEKAEIKFPFNNWADIVRKGSI
jgi:transposase InsO family protein